MERNSILHFFKVFRPVILTEGSGFAKLIFQHSDRVQILLPLLLRKGSSQRLLVSRFGGLKGGIGRLLDAEPDQHLFKRDR